MEWRVAFAEPGTALCLTDRLKFHRKLKTRDNFITCLYLLSKFKENNNNPYIVIYHRGRILRVHAKT